MREPDTRVDKHSKFADIPGINSLNLFGSAFGRFNCSKAPLSDKFKTVQATSVFEGKHMMADCATSVRGFVLRSSNAKSDDGFITVFILSFIIQITCYIVKIT